jgi:hypothetical protein
VACEDLLEKCTLALVVSLGAVVAALVAIVKANHAHKRIDEVEEEKKG